MNILRKVGAELQMAGEACGRIAGEYHDIARAQRGEQRWFDLIFYVRPLSRREHDWFTMSINKAAGLGPDEARSLLPPLPLRPPPETTAFYCMVQAPTADAAAARGLNIVRSALRDAKITTSVLRFEVEEHEEER